VETVGKAAQYISRFPDTPEIPEVRFILASALKKMGRNREALEQVLLLLKSQQKLASVDVDTWRYWQQRTGNEIANQLYEEKDYVNALAIYQSLAEVNDSANWQVPVFYQVGLVYEKLAQPAKAIETYDRILNREKDLKKDSISESLKAVIDMARWRKSQIQWEMNAKKAGEGLIPSLPESKSDANP
jgi:tetratricopeptide (TPR) repeat protein